MALSVAFRTCPLNWNYEVASAYLLAFHWAGLSVLRTEVSAHAGGKAKHYSYINLRSYGMWVQACVYDRSPAKSQNHSLFLVNPPNKSWAHCMCLFVSFNRSGRLLLNLSWIISEWVKKNTCTGVHALQTTQRSMRILVTWTVGSFFQPLSRLSYGILVLPQICSSAFPHSPPASEQAFSDPLLTSRSNWDWDWISRLIVWPVSHPQNPFILQWQLTISSWNHLVRIKVHLQTSARPIEKGGCSRTGHTNAQTRHRSLGSQQLLQH